MNKYKKFLVALTGFVVIALSAAFGTNPPTWFEPLISLLSALGVYQVRNAK